MAKKKKKNRIDYTALMCSMQSTIAKQMRKNPHVIGIADLLNIRCHQLCNDGVFQNARELLTDELERGGMFIEAEFVEIILAGDAPGFWHWKDDALIVDCYSLEVQSKYLTEKRKLSYAGKISGEKRRANAEQKTESARDGTHVQTHVQTHVRTKKEINTTFTGSISKAGPSAGAMGPGFDGAATAAEKQPPEARRAREAFATMNPDAE